MHFDSDLVRILFYILLGAEVVILLFLGYRVGRWSGRRSSRRLISSREQEMFTAQRGVKTLHDQEISQANQTIAELQEQVRLLSERVEEYRKKASGFGGLFGSGKRAEAMYALLLENEALEEALTKSHEKLSQERIDALKEQSRSTDYRRILMSQILKDDRMRGFVNEALSDTKSLPPQESH